MLRAILSTHPRPLRKLVSAYIWLNVSEQSDSRHTTWKISMHSVRSKTHILGIFTPFRCSKTSVWFRTAYITSKTRVLVGFMPFRCRTWPIVKISIGCIKCTSLCLWNHFLFYPNEHAQSTILGLTLMFWVVPCHSAAALDTSQKPVARCI